MVKPNYAVLTNTSLVGTYSDLPSALSAIELGGGNVYERMGQGARASEKLAEIVAMAKRYSHPGVEPGTHAFAHKVLVIAGEREVGK